jgi:hypothetical protein
MPAWAPEQRPFRTRTNRIDASWLEMLGEVSVTGTPDDLYDPWVRPTSSTPPLDRRRTPLSVHQAIPRNGSLSPLPITS